MDDADVAAVDQHQDRGSGVGSADSDVVQPAVVAESEFAVAIDHITTDPGLRLGFWQLLVGWIWAGPGRPRLECDVFRERCGRQLL